ncbi:hypothetical protein DFP72DRAFT_845312 [Ephemerocybe angulata]|uniref:Uncharacterized protein n=1 Tax=Ephemerocybe angulata TaxID=980116 RepID=A0A8H6I3T8_9AGAR|nr:hypothetical protein DFP72DRAFT_845312 [Tulosesus angulatus]
MTAQGHPMTTQVHPMATQGHPGKLHGAFLTPEESHDIEAEFAQPQDVADTQEGGPPPHMNEVLCEAPGTPYTPNEIAAMDAQLWEIFGVPVLEMSNEERKGMWSAALANSHPSATSTPTRSDSPQEIEPENIATMVISESDPNRPLARIINLGTMASESDNQATLDGLQEYLRAPPHNLNFRPEGLPGGPDDTPHIPSNTPTVPIPSATPATSALPAPSSHPDASESVYPGSASTSGLPSQLQPPSASSDDMESALSSGQTATVALAILGGGSARDTVGLTISIPTNLLWAELLEGIASFFEELTEPVPPLWREVEAEDTRYSVVQVQHFHLLTHTSIRYNPFEVLGTVKEVREGAAGSTSASPLESAQIPDNWTTPEGQSLYQVQLIKDIHTISGEEHLLKMYREQTFQDELAEFARLASSARGMLQTLIERDHALPPPAIDTASHSGMSTQFRDVDIPFLMRLLPMYINRQTAVRAVKIGRRLYQAQRNAEMHLGPQLPADLLLLLSFEISDTPGPDYARLQGVQFGGWRQPLILSRSLVEIYRAR